MFSEQIAYTKENGPFTICDYGCATGQTSEKMLMKAIRNIQKIHGSQTEIQLFFNDQVENDFKSLFLRTHGEDVGLFLHVSN